MISALPHTATHCRFCDRELFLPDGREPIRIFDPDLKPVTETRPYELYDDNVRRSTLYVYCNQQHYEAYRSWEKA